MLFNTNTKMSKDNSSTTCTKCKDNTQTESPFDVSNTLCPRCAQKIVAKTF